MIKTILMLIAKVLESKLVKTGVEETILKNQNYFTEAKKVWNMIDENYRITEKVEDKLASKADEFDKALLAKFPELTQDDITSLRQSIAGEINTDKDAVVSNSDLLKQLQASNASLESENVNLKAQLSQFKSILNAINSSTSVDNSSTNTTTTDGSTTASTTIDASTTDVGTTSPTTSA